MKLSPRDKWISLHTQYYVDPQAKHSSLLMDAHILLDSAHGIVQTLSDTLCDGDVLNNDRLCSALNGVAMLVEMGRRCVAQADLRITLGRLDESDKR